MTRKKFVKNLMSRGISRNRANEIARTYSCKRSYASFNSFDLLGVDFADEIGKFSVSLKQASKNVRRFIARLNERKEIEK